MLLSLPVTLEAICETSDHETDRGDCWKQNCWRRGCWRRDTGGEAARPTATLTMRLLAPAMSWPTVPREPCSHGAASHKRGHREYLFIPLTLVV